MLIHISQAVPGCILEEDLKGKSGRPIMYKGTVLTDSLITVLEKFLITQLRVSNRLENGKSFIPKQVDRSKIKNSKMPPTLESGSFLSHYQRVVEAFKTTFEKWRNKPFVDVPALRQIVIPLFKRTEEVEEHLLTLPLEAKKESYLFHHSIALGLLSTYLAQILGYQEGESLQVGLAGVLCDCGMAKIDENIWKKRGRLHEEEMQEIKRHPLYSYQMVEKAKTLTQGIKISILQHHERIDGSGYPLGLSGNSIHSFARMIAICDVYHAMMSERVYQKGHSLFEVIDELREEQFSKLDPHYVLTFTKRLTNQCVGMHVKLSNGKVGEIIFIHHDEPTRPMVKLEKKEQIISLKEHPELYIKKIVNPSKNLSS